MNREGELWLIKHPSAWSKLATTDDEYYFITSSESIGNGRTRHTTVIFNITNMNKKDIGESIEYNCFPWETRKDRTRVG